MKERGTPGECAPTTCDGAAYSACAVRATGRIGGSNRPALPRVLPHADRLNIVTTATTQR